CLVFSSSVMRRPASAAETPCFFNSSARVRISEISSRSAPTSEPSPGALWSGRTCAGWSCSIFSTTASQLDGVPPSPKMFGMVLFCTTSPERRVRSGSTEVSSSPLVCAPPYQSRRAVTPPPRSSFFSLSKVSSGFLGFTPASSSFCSGERIDHFLAVLLHLLLLHGVADDRSAGRKAGFTRSVFRMEVRSGEIDLPAGRELRDYARDGFAVLRSKPGIDNQHRVAPDHNSDIRPPHNGPDVIGNLCRGVRQDGVVALCRRARGRRQNCQRGSENVGKHRHSASILSPLTIDSFTNEYWWTGHSARYKKYSV